MTTVTSKIQIYVSPDEAESLLVTGKAYQRACNFLSEKVFKTKELRQPKLNGLYYQNIRARFGLKSQMAQSVMKTVIARYKAARSNGQAWSLVTFKVPTYDLVWNRDYSLVEKAFSVNTLDGRLKFRFEKKGMRRYFDGTWKFGTAKLVRKTGKWFLHIPMTNNVSEMDLSKADHVVGIDLGINFLATAYDSKGKTIFFSGREMKAKRGAAKALRKQLQQKQTSSSRSRLKERGSRENRYVSDVNHRTTKALVERYPKGTVFVLEDLTGVRNATEKVRTKQKYVSVSWAFYQFRKMLEYKAELNGQRVLVVDPKYTSQTCPKCGHVEKGNRDKRTHTFCCKNCRYMSNDDRIGAMNLHRKGIETISGSVQCH